ncbi:formate dehydrogenase accessory sulfurtransferase FdhD [Actinomadura craniellae]|uniref:Sulfur carrier protein FdhD n=1 Tax=Actinomadura craniellae TaxID=2231787 RepID=A0A365H4Y7_9ACTN|nr:formate dehydrogenase accessory sulfurtransferase FdhD [Actinomadura craniellae]
MTVRRPVLRLRAGRAPDRRPDALAVEEPLEIRIGGRPLTVTMRTPGDDFDLVAGFLSAEGAIGGPADLAAMRHCADGGENTYNVVDVRLAEGVPEPVPARAFPVTSACGVCGTESIEALRRRARFDVGADPVRLDPRTVIGLPGALRAAQRAFDRTGGLHAAGLFDGTGRALAVREDVGRHNAVDKVVGWALREDRLPLAGTVLMVSGRASFELVQKAVQAGVPVLAAVSAPSSLAAELAEAAGLTLIGFLRGDSMNVYAGAHRLLA